MVDGLGLTFTPEFGFKIEVPDPLGSLDLPSEGWLKGLNVGVSDLLGEIKIEVPDPLGSLDLPSEGWLKGLNVGVSDLLGEIKIEVPDPLGGLDLPSEGWLKGLNVGVSDLLGEIKIEVPDPLGSLDLPSEGWLKGLNVGVSDLLGEIKIEVPDPLGSLDPPSEGWLKGLNVGVSDLLGDFKVEMTDVLGSLTAPSLATSSKPAREYTTRDRVAENAADLYQNGNLLDWFDSRITNSGLRHGTRKLFADGHYSMAVFKAFLYVENFVQERSGVVDKDGADLMNKVFSVKNPVVRLNACRNKSERNEQLGYMQMFAGAMTAIRNPRAHEFDWYDDPEEALELLVFANHLVRRISRAQRSPT